MVQEFAGLSNGLDDSTVSVNPFVAFSEGYSETGILRVLD